MLLFNMLKKGHAPETRYKPAMVYAIALNKSVAGSVVLYRVFQVVCASCCFCMRVLYQCWRAENGVCMQRM